jgi:hypothetical protein
MKPVAFAGHNLVFAKDQPQYLPLPAHRAEDGRVVTCWSFAWKERFQVLFGAKLWLGMLTFNQPLQPVLPQIKRELALKAPRV